MIGICKDCKKREKLTKHSKFGGHQSPFEWICRECHDKRHKQGLRRIKQNVKIQRGSRNRKSKMKKFK